MNEMSMISISGEWVIILITLAISLSILRANMENIDRSNNFGYDNRNARQQSGTFQRTNVHVPFFYVAPSAAKNPEMPVQHLLRALDKFKDSCDNGIKSLIESREIALKSEWLVFPRSGEEGGKGDRRTLSSVLEKRITLTAEVLEADYFVLEDVIRPFGITYGLPEVDGKSAGETLSSKVDENDLQNQDVSSYDTAMQVIAHIVRDWSQEGKQSRNSLYQWSINQLRRHFDPQISPYKVLIPGAGLGRLAYDASLAGYRVEANEISLVMAAAAHSLLHGKAKGVVHPFAFDFLINEVNSSDRYQTVEFPDEDPSKNFVKGEDISGATGALSFTIGDFVEIYSQKSYKGSFSSVITCFFIDTASNIYEYLLVIRNVLKSGGVWINVGPLQWHQNAKLHPSGDELRIMMESMGFQLLHWSVDEEAINYRHDDRTEGTRYTKYEGYRPLRFTAILPSTMRSQLQDEDTVHNIHHIREVLNPRKEAEFMAPQSQQAWSQVTVEELS